MMTTGGSYRKLKYLVGDRNLSSSEAKKKGEVQQMESSKGQSSWQKLGARRLIRLPCERDPDGSFFLGPCLRPHDQMAEKQWWEEKAREIRIK